MSRPLVGFLLTVLIATSCGDTASLKEAGDKINAPAEFVLQESETLQGFSQTSRQYTYSTNVSQREACELSAAALQDWAGEEVVESPPGLPATMCSYIVRNPKHYPHIDLAAASVSRLRTDDEFELDETKAGGAGTVSIGLQVDT